MTDTYCDIKQQIMDEARRTNKAVSVTIPSMYSHMYTGGISSVTTWTATPNMHGGVELTFNIHSELDQDNK